MISKLPLLPVQLSDRPVAKQFYAGKNRKARAIVAEKAPGQPVSGFITENLLFKNTVL
jgi:hypothetical protein